MDDVKKPKTSLEAEPEMIELRTRYKVWKEENQKQKKGFFIIYNSFCTNKILKELSGNSIRLFLYLGIYSNNQTGEVWHSTKKISEYFDCDERTVKRWFKELEDKGLIKRIQKGYKRVANTFLKPY